MPAAILISQYKEHFTANIVGIFRMVGNRVNINTTIHTRNVLICKIRKRKSSGDQRCCTKSIIINRLVRLNSDRNSLFFFAYIKYTRRNCCSKGYAFIIGLFCRKGSRYHAYA